MQQVKHSFSWDVKHGLLSPKFPKAENQAMQLSGPKFGAYLKRLAKSRDVSNTRLAEVADVTLQAVTGWFNTGSIARENLLAIAPELGASVDQILQGKAHLGQGNATSTRARTHQIPVVSWVAAGSWNEAADPYAPGAAHRWEDVDETIGKAAFALEVRGDSMEKPGGRVSFPDGCLIIVDPTRKPKPGDFVVVRNNDSDEAMFKEYVIDGGIKSLKPLNPQYRTQQIGSGTVMVGVVVLKIEKQRF